MRPANLLGDHQTPGMMMTFGSQPFTRQQALAELLSDVDLRGPRFHRIFQGVYVSSSTPIGVNERARAALLVSHPQAQVSHHTAAVLLGAWAPPTTQTHLSVPIGTPHSIRRGVTVHFRSDQSNPVRKAGLPLSPPWRLFLEMATVHLSLVELVCVGDSLIRTGMIEPSDLVRAASEWRGHGARRARLAAGLVRTGVDSSTESRLRLLIVLAGLPEPVVNLVLRDEYGAPVYRLDLGYEDLCLAIEYDGRHHAENSKQWIRDIRRREELERSGWRLIVITADDLFVHPTETLNRIRRALADRGAELPRRTPPVWARHFVDR